MLKDVLILEDLYNQILLNEDAASSKAQALNMLIRKEVGDDIFKYKNKPENKEIINKASINNQPIVDDYSNFVSEKNPNDKNLSDMLKLVQFYIEDPNAKEIIKQEYEDYLKLPSIRQNPFLRTAKTFRGWADRIHSEKTDTEEQTNQKEFKNISINDDPNKVYDDDKVIVFLANNTKNPKQSVVNCIHYGKKSGLCISSSNARYYYHLYRKRDELTTYFVFLKTRGHFMLVDVVPNEADSYQYNAMFKKDESGNLKATNNDIPASKSEILNLYPELEGALNSGKIKEVPLSEEEKRFYDKFYEQSIRRFSELNDLKIYIQLNGINYDDWEHIKDNENLDVLLNIAISDLDDDIPDDILSKFPQIKNRYWKQLEKNLIKEITEWSDQDSFDLTEDESKIFLDVYDKIDPENKKNFQENLKYQSPTAFSKILNSAISSASGPEEKKKTILKLFNGFGFNERIFNKLLKTSIDSFLSSYDTIGTVPDFIYEIGLQISDQKNLTSADDEAGLNISKTGKFESMYLTSFLDAVSLHLATVEKTAFGDFPDFPFGIMNIGIKKAEKVLSKISDDPFQSSEYMKYLYRANRELVSYIRKYSEYLDIIPNYEKEGAITKQEFDNAVNSYKKNKDEIFKFIYKELLKAEDEDDLTDKVDGFLSSIIVNYDYKLKIPDYIIDFIIKKLPNKLDMNHMLIYISHSDSSQHYFDLLMKKTPFKVLYEIKKQKNKNVINIDDSSIIKYFESNFDDNIKLYYDAPLSPSIRDIKFYVENSSKYNSSEAFYFIKFINFLDHKFEDRDINKSILKKMKEYGMKNEENFLIYFLYYCASSVFASVLHYNSYLEEIGLDMDSMSWFLLDLDKTNPDLYNKIISNKKILSELCYWIRYCDRFDTGVFLLKDSIKEKYFNVLEKTIEEPTGEEFIYLLKAAHDPETKPIITNDKLKFLSDDFKLKILQKLLSDKKESIYFIARSVFDIYDLNSLPLPPNKQKQDNDDKINFGEKTINYNQLIYLSIAKKYGMEIFEKVREYVNKMVEFTKDTPRFYNAKPFLNLNNIENMVREVLESKRNSSIIYYWNKMLDRLESKMEILQAQNESFNQFFKRKFFI
jgi:hypothetical protein